MNNFPTVILPIKSSLQSNPFNCGPAVVHSVLETMGKRITEKHLASLLKTKPYIGTAPAQIPVVLKKLTISHSIKKNASQATIEASLRAGSVCIVLYQAWTEGAVRIRDTRSGHYSIIFGMSKDHFYFADPYQFKKNLENLSGFRRMRKDRFIDRWHGRDQFNRIIHHWMIEIPILR